ncbi:MAG: hypothetical protein GY754_16230 [bacterium]|nr:hypothetical protein [bacterium]
MKGKTVKLLNSVKSGMLIFALALPVFMACDVEVTELNKALHRTHVLKNPGENGQIVLAYAGKDLDQAYLDNMLESARSSYNADFTIVKLVRILHFTDKYDDQILPVLKAKNYWLKKNEVDNCYWSENHMIMWMSSAWLLRQREGWQMGSTLEQRLHHYLDLKLEYGFYEFFSTDYAPFTLTGLLNLADFAEDEEIREKATLAAQRLLTGMLKLVNSKGACFPAAGRNYSEFYTNAWGRNYNKLLYIVTGKGEAVTSASHSSVFLATSGIDISGVADSWTPTLNTTYSFGHGLGDSSVHSGLNRQDRTIFQWSAGGYFHPDVADDTTYTADYYNIAEDKLGGFISELPNFPDWMSLFGAKIGATFSRSSCISQATIDIYRNNGSVLTSIDNYYPGYFGWQQWPWMATVDDIAVWTQSGPVKADWADRSRMSANSHLPYIKQEDNVALIVYWPNTEISIADKLGVNALDRDVSLYWPTEKFDETMEHGRWIIGRKGDSYVAVFRDGGKTKHGYYYSDANGGRQTWGAVVGNSDTHGSYSEFVDMIKDSSYKITYKWSWSKWKMVYYTRLSVDGKSISKTWY